MRTFRWAVWEWREYGGWTPMLGTDSKAAADQVELALRTYQPQLYYGTYPNWRLADSYEIAGKYRGRRISWGWTTRRDTVWIIDAALDMILSPAVALYPRGDVPSIVQASLDRRNAFAEGISA